jgi:hypothetical protein
MAKATIRQLDAHCDLLRAAIIVQPDGQLIVNVGAILESVEKMQEMARRMEEWFIRIGLEV